MSEKNERPFEERLVELTDWFKRVGEVDITKGEEIPNIDQQLVKGVLVDLGANTEISEETKASLARYSNYYKRPGLNAVWGKEKMKTLVRWMKNDFIPQYEQRVGRQLHTLWDPKTEIWDKNKHSGMLQFLGELTAFAEGVLPMGEYKRLTKTRIDKGIKFEFGDPYEPYKPSKNAGFPPEFPLKALNYLISNKSK